MGFERLEVRAKQRTAFGWSEDDWKFFQNPIPSSMQPFLILSTKGHRSLQSDTFGYLWI